jgi:hypothetical protein
MQRRCVAVDGAMSVVLALRASIQSVSSLLPQSVVEQRLASVAAQLQCGDELLQVIMHRMVLANFPTDQFSTDLEKLFNNPAKWSQQPSKCMSNLTSTVQRFLGQRPEMPTRRLDNMFLCRVVFAVQSIMIQSYAQLIMNPKQEFSVMNLNRRKAETGFLLQLTVDARSFNNEIQDMLPIGRDGIALPNVVSEFVAAAYEEDFEKRKAWIARYHAPYAAADMANWLCMSSRTKKKELDAFIGTLQHADAIPLFTPRE